jgi:hypothetical protein
VFKPLWNNTIPTHVWCNRIIVNPLSCPFYHHCHSFCLHISKCVHTDTVYK